ncbi:hypothetical protein CLAIMM_07499 isoform 1 [Cladophialophora immunda]|nr:hypothetical protein CLAIMM_07499 isoform 1 [Cladophialophora immunda]
MISQHTGNWKTIAQSAQEDLRAKIPSEWRLEDDLITSSISNVSDVISKSKILSESELMMTSVGDATELLVHLRTGEWSAEATMRAFCKRAALAHQLVNCLTAIRFNEAIDAARKLDNHLKSTGSPMGPLHGLPLSVKDHLNVTGERSTGGYCMFADNIATSDSVLVKALQDAGAIVFVKTTMPVTGMIFETISNLWGRTVSPYNRRLTCGGSSGGKGALIALRGSMIGIGSDIGGSIRIPCAFNGIYGLRPTAKRLSFQGGVSVHKGQIAIPAVVGPMAHSVRGLDLFCRVATQAKPWYLDVNVVAMDWKTMPTIGRKLVIGVMKSDGVVRPHPPILDALDKAEATLKAAGHDVIRFEPYQSQRCWDILYPLYYPTGGKEMAAALAVTGEPWPVAAKKMSNAPSLREPTVTELFELHAARDEYKMEYLHHWNSTAQTSDSGQLMDALLCPVSASTSFPHDFLPWWGYTSQFNILDYPGITLPVGVVDKDLHPKDSAYVPMNEIDEENHHLYDPNVYHQMPIALQLVGRPYEDEKLLAVATIIDRELNKGNI